MAPAICTPKGLHAVTGVDAVAVGGRGLHAPSRRLRAHAEMQRRGRIPHEHVGRGIGGACNWRSTPENTAAAAMPA